ncbi:RtcB family protein [Actinomadura sp. K4S16]|uniref:RtcB family protein n=1 Tax=Actinomadura sp. K4S16 TaxID=1316147 RepID=UPI0035D0EAFE
MSRASRPGRCGAAGYVLRRHGNPRTLASACHGAGRRVPRGAASRAGDTKLDAFLMHRFRCLRLVEWRPRL